MLRLKMIIGIFGRNLLVDLIRISVLLKDLGRVGIVMIGLLIVVLIFFNFFLLYFIIIFGLVGLILNFSFSSNFKFI